MACTSPLIGYRADRVNPDTGKRSIVFQRQAGYSDLPVELPCGQCIGCRIARSREWALRCVHESKMHTFNSFVTLTYDPEHYPADSSISKRTLQLFLKRVRKAGYEFRYFACGEYGDSSQRAHYHVLFFGVDWNHDRSIIKRSSKGILYTSPSLVKLWGFGHVTISSFTYQTAAYVSSYVIKRQTGENADEHDDYARLNINTGEVSYVQRPFVLMSRRPGLGTKWYEKFKTDAFPSDFLIHDEKKFPVPRFYTDKLRATSETDYKAVRGKRRNNLSKNAHNRIPDRLEAKRAILKARQNLKTRSL